MNHGRFSRRMRTADLRNAGSAGAQPPDCDLAAQRTRPLMPPRLRSTADRRLGARSCPCCVALAHARKRLGADVRSGEPFESGHCSIGHNHKCLRKPARIDFVARPENERVRVLVVGLLPYSPEHIKQGGRRHVLGETLLVCAAEIPSGSAGLDPTPPLLCESTVKFFLSRGSKEHRKTVVRCPRIRRRQHVHSILTRNQSTKPVPTGMWTASAPRVPRDRKRATHNLFARQLQRRCVIGRNRLSGGRRIPQHRVIHRVVRLRRDPRIGFLIEYVRILNLTVKAPESCPRLPEGAFDAGCRPCSMCSSLDAPGRRMVPHTVVDACCQAVPEPIEPANHPGQVFKVVHVGAKRFGIFGVRSLEKHPTTLESVAEPKPLIFERRRQPAQEPSLRTGRRCVQVVSEGHVSAGQNARSGVGAIGQTP